MALREAGAHVSAVPAATVREPGHRDAHRFLRRHRRELAAVPVAVFGMGPREGTEEA